MINRAACRRIFRSPYSMCRCHEWRGFKIHSSGKWPKITIGWWTWDKLPDEVGARVTELTDTLWLSKKAGR